VHLFINSLALKGEISFNQGVSLLHSVPYLWALELFFIFIPLIFHALYGIWVVYLTRNNVLTYAYFRNWLFYLQRVTALIALVFVVWHVVVLRFANGIFGNEVNYTFVSQALSNPVVTMLYVLGLLATFAHFANGLWSLLISWGITIGAKAQRSAAYVCLGVFVILMVVVITYLLGDYHRG
jgi:succinate dehydrogenase / fumarate reductase cytochrome b subunit